jgi:hypothetical protein
MIKIKYQFAYDSARNVVNINDLSKECKNKSDKFLCLSCDKELVTVLGEKRRKHFRHKAITEINCSPETYLHKLAKLKFYEVYQNCLEKKQPFIIRILMNQVCNFYEKDFLFCCDLESSAMVDFDLTQQFTKIRKEARLDSFIPDILLESFDEKRKLFFEIVVTHKSEENKINSGHEIIEFLISSEDDIKLIESCLLTESENINFFNFSRLHKDIFCNQECIKKIGPYAKYKFYQIYEECLRQQKPFYIEILMNKVCNFYEKEFLQTCQLPKEMVSFDLTQYFKNISIQKIQSSLIPDINVILESDTGEKILFEVLFANKPRIEENHSNHRIIQLFIDSEDDIAIIDSCIFKETPKKYFFQEKIKFLNFDKNKFYKQDWCKGLCLLEKIKPYEKEYTLYNVFVIYQNGRSRLHEYKTLEEIESFNNVLNIEYIAKSNKYHKYNPAFIYKMKVVESYLQGLKIKNCYLCKYHTIYKDYNQKGSISCQFSEEEKIGNSNMAIDCPYFRPDSDVFVKYKPSLLFSKNQKNNDNDDIEYLDCIDD